MTWRIEVIATTGTFVRVVMIDHPRQLREHLNALGAEIQPMDLLSVKCEKMSA